MIESGLSGVVGPNGCGKSNILEAMRWVMGENSPKSMRGTGMEDVIFAGTSGRPARNMAEVVLVIDNSERKAPSAYNDADTIEVSRRIERDAGSAYRINGRDVRARDVQTFFADAATGAHSTALVRQGQIGELINAKPKNRRKILEEAAGISGLHSRRHEAELRLRAAETNLTRLDDVVQQIESQLANLKRQARQARRYRNLSGLIRKAEATNLQLRWSAAQDHLTETKEKATAAEQLVAETTQKASEANRLQLAANDELPPLREEEAKAAAAYHRLTVERDGLDAEEERARREAEELEARLEQTVSDLQRENAMIRDAQQVLDRLTAEENEITEKTTQEEETLRTLQQQADGASARLAEKEKELEAMTARIAALTASRHALTKSVDEAEARLTSLEQQKAGAVQEQDAIRAAGFDSEKIGRAADAVEQAKASVERARHAFDEAEHSRSERQAAEKSALEPLQEADRSLGKLKAEAKALSDMLGVTESDLWQPLIDTIRVEPGYEKALGAALGSDLDATDDTAAPVHWENLGPLYDPDGAHGLPGGATPLSRFVWGPAAFERRLSQIGVVEQSMGPSLQRQLKPGQRLVSKEGDFWRWDGFLAAADAPTHAATKLAQRNRLQDIQMQIVEAERHASSLRQTYHEARAAAEQAVALEASERKNWRERQSALSTAQEELLAAEKEAAAHSSKMTSLEEAKERAVAEITTTTQKRDTARQELSALEDEETLRQQISTAREAVSEHRAQAANTRAELESAGREAAQRQQRLSQIKTERDEWERRTEKARTQVETLTERRSELKRLLDEKRAFPETLQEKRSALLTAMTEAEGVRNRAADALSIGEAALTRCNNTLKEAQQAQSDAREERARMEALLEGAHERQEEIAERVRETLDCQPDQIMEAGEITEKDLNVDMESIEKRLERLKRERENLGGVNLRAEEESAELEEQLQGMLTEREDLEGAIAKLRQGISKLNSEGRERLLKAFDEVNANFEKLFTLLFSGGTAALELVESDDPLEAGLEINARPPGKKTQTMSLLSGGEQALTAIALIFAVFLCNPAPICVMDEVDAPLDDTNVDRFCNLLDEMRRLTDTRFIVITHHALSMSRMDRLFGVTMAERGVSQLVSLDLEAAEEVRAAG